jgi:hypothetical protein
LSNFFVRIKRLYRERKLTGLIKDVLAHYHIYERSQYYVIERHYPLKEEPPFTLKVANPSFTILTTLRQLEELKRDGYEFVLNVNGIKKKRRANEESRMKHLREDN